jgi:hypothetical protein
LRINSDWKNPGDLAEMVVRLTELERRKVQALAEKLGVSVSEVVQDWIKTLPDKSSDGS